MTVDTFQPQTAVEVTPQDATVERLIRWAEGARAAEQLANALCRTPFCPKAFQGKPVEAAAAMLAGSEIGLSPIAALSAFDVIEGKAAPRAITLRATVQSKGHSIVVVESTEQRCVIKGRRKGDADWQESIWTIARAQKMRLTGKDNWQKGAQGMLLARATSEISRMIASDAILGIAYSIEELTDEAADEAPPATRTVQRASARPAAATPPAVERTPVTRPAAPAGPPLPGEEQATPAELADQLDEGTWRRINERFREIGVNGNGQQQGRLVVIRAIVGRPDLQQGSQMTASEGQLVLDNLAGQVGEAMVATILTRDGAPEHLIPASATPAQSAAPSGPPLPGEDDSLPDPADGDDPWATGVQEHEDDAARAEAAAEQ